MYGLFVVHIFFSLLSCFIPKVLALRSRCRHKTTQNRQFWAPSFRHVATFGKVPFRDIRMHCDHVGKHENAIFAFVGK